MKEKNTKILLASLLGLGLFLSACSSDSGGGTAQSSTDENQSVSDSQSQELDSPEPEVDVSTPTAAFVAVFQAICKNEAQFHGDFPEGEEIYLDLSQTELLDEVDKGFVLRRAQEAIPNGVTVVEGTWDDLISEGRAVQEDESGNQTMENVRNIILTERNFINETQFTIAQTTGGSGAFTEYTVTLNSDTGAYSCITAGVSD